MPTYRLTCFLGFPMTPPVGGAEERMDTPSCRTFACRGHWAPTYTRSQLNRVSRRGVREENGLVVHTASRPAPRPTACAPHGSVSPLSLALIPVVGNKSPWEAE